MRFISIDCILLYYISLTYYYVFYLLIKMLFILSKIFIINYLIKVYKKKTNILHNNEKFKIVGIS